LLEISGSHSNIISDSYIFHYGNELVSRTVTVNKEIRHFVATDCDQKCPFAPWKKLDCVYVPVTGHIIPVIWHVSKKQ